MLIRNYRSKKNEPTRGKERLYEYSRLRGEKSNHCDVTEDVMDGLAYEIFWILRAQGGVK